MTRRPPLAALALALLLLPASAGAARLVSVTPRDGAPVAGPTGPNVEAWDVQPGRAYTVRLDQVTDRANGGTDATLGVLLMSSATGNVFLTAHHVGTGVYEFDVTLASSACATMPIRYGVTDGMANTGVFIGRHDTGTSQAHLRASEFTVGGSAPRPVICGTTAAAGDTWGRLKSIYR